MSADDLSGLFAKPPPGPSQDMRYRQGTILAFDPVTLANPVDVGGTLCTDLALLGVGEARLLEPGAVVGVVSVTSAKATATYAIIGRLVLPNTAEAAVATTLLNSQVISAAVLDEETLTSNVYGDLATVGPTVDVNVGASGRLLVIITTQINWEDLDTFSTNGGFATVEMDGANVMSALTAKESLAALTLFGFLPGGSLLFINSATATTTFEGLNPGPTKITMKYRTSNGVEACSFARRNLVVVTL